MLFDALAAIFVSRLVKIFWDTKLRRSTFVWCTALLAAASCLVTPALADKTHLLTSGRKPGDLTQVTVGLDVEGKLRFNPDGKKVIEIPLSVAGKLQYDERLLVSDPKKDKDEKPLFRAVRYYHENEVKIDVSGRVSQPALSEDRRLIVAERAGGVTTLFSPLGPLTREELELIDIQGSSLLAPMLLPGKEVKIGDRWKHDTAVLAGLLGVEAISQCDVESTLSDLAGSVATMKLKGHVSGAVGGVATEIDVTAQYRFDLEKRRITGLDMEIKETRAIGHAAPGLDVTARLQLKLTPADKSVSLSDQSLADLPLAAHAGLSLLSFESEKGRFGILHDRRWHVLNDLKEATIMRLIDKGELVAQCNIVRMPNLPAGKQVALKAFQDDVRASLDKHLEQFVEATESKTETGLRQLRVVAVGTVSEVPIQWIYYLVTDDRGHRAALVFTLESKLAEQFAGSDGPVVGNLRFQDDARQPIAADPDEPAAKEAKNR